MERFKESRLVFPLQSQDDDDWTLLTKYALANIMNLILSFYEIFYYLSTNYDDQDHWTLESKRRWGQNYQATPNFSPSSKLSSRAAASLLHLKFFLPTNCQLGPWDLRLSPPNLQQTWNLLDSALLSRRRRHMAKLRITGFLLVFPPSDDNLIKSQMVSGLLPKAIIRQRSVSSLPLEAQMQQGWVISYL